MDLLKKDKKEKYATIFSQWDKTLQKNKVANLEALYKKVHSEIRKSPKKVKAERKQAAVRKVLSKEKGALIIEDFKKRKYIRNKKITRQERKDRVMAKFAKASKKIAK